MPKNKKLLIIIAAVIGAIVLLCSLCVAVVVIFGEPVEEGATEESSSESVEVSSTEESSESSEETASVSMSSEESSSSDESTSTVDILDLYRRSLAQIESEYGVTASDSGTIRINTEEHVITIDSIDGLSVASVNFEIKSMECNADESILDDLEPAMSYVGIDSAQLGEPANPDAGVRIGAAEFCGLGNYSIALTCAYDGSNLEVTISDANDPGSYCPEIP